MIEQKCTSRSHALGHELAAALLTLSKLVDDILGSVGNGGQALVDTLRLARRLRSRRRRGHWRCGRGARGCRRGCLGGGRRCRRRCRRGRRCAGGRGALLDLRAEADITRMPRHHAVHARQQPSPCAGGARDGQACLWRGTGRGRGPRTIVTVSKMIPLEASSACAATVRGSTSSPLVRGGFPCMHAARVTGQAAACSLTASKLPSKAFEPAKACSMPEPLEQKLHVA